MPAARAARPVEDPALGHLRNLFVARAQWGSGLATALLRAAEQDARDRGFTELRLFVAEGQARARRFYEREGWRAGRRAVLRSRAAACRWSSTARALG